MLCSRGESLTHHDFQMRTYSLIAIGAAALFATACAGAPKGQTISGTFQLVDKDISRLGQECRGTGGYSDIQSGLDVIIKSGSGNIIAKGNLGSDNYKGEYSRVTCNFPFSIGRIPKSKFYTIEVGRRGALTYSYDELEERDWKVELNLG